MLFSISVKNSTERAGKDMEKVLLGWVWKVKNPWAAAVSANCSSRQEKVLFKSNIGLA